MTAVAYPQWLLDIVVPGQVYSSEAAIMTRTIKLSLAPRIDAMTFSGTSSERHRSVDRAHIGVLRAGLSKEFQEWRAPQVADCAKLLGTARYTPSQSRASVLADLQLRLTSNLLVLPDIHSCGARRLALAPN